MSVVVYDPLHDPIVIGEPSDGARQFWGKATYLLMDDSGEVEKEDFFIFNVFSATDAEAQEKITEYFKDLNSKAEAQCLDLELDLLDIVLMERNINKVKESK